MAPLSDSVKDFAETSAGRVVVVAVPVAILAVIIAFVALTMLRGEGASQIADTGAESTKSVSSVAENGESTPTAPVADGSTGNTGGLSESTETTSYINENFEVYETRDPFKPAEATATPSAGNPSSGSATAGSSDGASSTTVLTLRSIQEGMDGIRYANVTYGSASYTVSEGERLGSSPYKVVSVGSDSVTFLFGDDQVVLRVGESADK